jgi:hypothetical protein
MQSILLANIIHYFHMIIFLFVVTGIFYIPNKYLPFLIIITSFIILGWNKIFGSCYLTTLEHYLRTGKWIKKTAEEDDAPEFFRPFIKSITGINMTRETASKINTILFIVIIISAIIKYYIYL